MIDSKKLTEDDRHRFVIYTNGVGEKEPGYITSWNDTFIFVNYLKGETSAATSQSDLEFQIPEPKRGEDKLAMQNRCIHCHREHYALNVISVSKGLGACAFCGGMSHPMTYKEYNEKYNHGREKTNE